MTSYQPIHRSLGFVSGLLVLLGSSYAAPAAITWNLTFDDIANSTGVGFDDPTFGPTRVNTVVSVIGYIDGVVDESGIVDFTFLNSQTDGSGFLAAAGPFFSAGPNGFQNGSLFTHATTGTDPFGGVPDAEATFDFGFNWNSELDSPTGTEFDLFSVALHEVTHAMGFLSLVTSTGLSAITGTDPGVFSVYDSFLELGDGTALFGPGGDYLGTTGNLTSNDVFFDGTNATAANSGTPVPVYSPTTFVAGSSISHITTTNAVMTFSIGPGVEKRSYLSQEVGILQDIGWTVAIPEVSGTLILIPILGSGVAFFRRRTQRVAA